MSLLVVKDPDEVPVSGEGTWIVGFFGEFSQRASAARPSFEAFAAAHPEVAVYLVDVGAVRGVHGRFGVGAVPQAVAVKDGVVIRRVAGSQSPEGWARALVPHERTGGDAAPAPARPVPVVYTTPTCSWCTRVKQWLDSQGITYREVNIAQDERAARVLVERSGQTGVPQIEVGSQIVVGFDKPRLARLLGVDTP